LFPPDNSITQAGALGMEPRYTVEYAELASGTHGHTASAVCMHLGRLGEARSNDRFVDARGQARSSAGDIKLKRQVLSKFYVKNSR
jgi:hypothetical protein